LALILTRERLSLFDWPVGTSRLTVDDPGLWMVAFSPEGSLLATVANGTRVNVRDLSAPLPRYHDAHTRQATSISFSPGGTILASGSIDGTVILWDVSAWRERARYDWGIGPVHAVAFAPDGMTLAVGGDKGVVLCDIDGL